MLFIIIIIIIIAGVKGHAGVSQGQPEVKLLRNAIWPPNLVKNTALLWDFQILFVRNAMICSCQTTISFF